ncbi:MAG: nucleotidyltransferase family protein [Clostridia bacterium]|nr:nucleotidyltransferase family protein [Clostridia bacterium]
MSNVSIICEFNPLHNGHKYLLDTARSIEGIDTVACIMGGSFSQRADTYVADRFVRARWAIQAGADIVAEMRGVSSMLNAENFALSGVKSAIHLGSDYLLFGSECGDVDKLKKIANMLHAPTEHYTQRFQQYISSGIVYPKAVSLAIADTLGAEYADVLANPNDTLGIMYIKAIFQLNANITPLATKRIDGGYHSHQQQSIYVSAEAIRKSPDKYVDCMPEFVYQYLSTIPALESANLDTAILTCIQNAELSTLSSIYDMAEGLQNKFATVAEKVDTLEELLQLVKSKRYTLSRLKRLALYTLLNVTQDMVTLSINATKPRILAIKKSHAGMLKGAISCYNDNVSSEDMRLWDIENRLSRVRATITRQPYSNQKNTIFI